jgi:hypothetical protein
MVEAAEHRQLADRPRLEPVVGILRIDLLLAGEIERLANPADLAAELPAAGFDQDAAPLGPVVPPAGDVVAGGTRGRRP